MVRNIIVLPRKSATFTVSKQLSKNSEAVESVLSPTLHRNKSSESECSNGSYRTNEESRRVVRCRFVVRPAHPSKLIFKK